MDLDIKQQIALTSAKRIYSLRSEQKALNFEEKTEVAKLREITNEIEGVCKFKTIATEKIDWQSIVKELFMKFNVGVADIEEILRQEIRWLSNEGRLYDERY